MSDFSCQHCFLFTANINHNWSVKKKKKKVGLSFTFERAFRLLYFFIWCNRSNQTGRSNPSPSENRCFRLWGANSHHKFHCIASWRSPFEGSPTALSTKVKDTALSPKPSTPFCTVPRNYMLMIYEHQWGWVGNMMWLLLQLYIDQMANCNEPNNPYSRRSVSKWTKHMWSIWK